MSNKSWYVTLIQNTPLAVILVGIFLVIVGAAGGWPTPKLEVRETGWRIALASIGAIAAVSGGLLFWFERIRTSRPVNTSGRPLGSEGTANSVIAAGSDVGGNIVGKYHAEDDPNYVNIISHLSDKFYKVVNPVWEGVGIFDGETYWGIYKCNDKDKSKVRGRWGVHKAELRYESRRWVLEISGTEMNETSNPSHWKGRWFRADG